MQLLIAWRLNCSSALQTCHTKVFLGVCDPPPRCPYVQHCPSLLCRKHFWTQYFTSSYPLSSPRVLGLGLSDKLGQKSRRPGVSALYLEYLHSEDIQINTSSPFSIVSFHILGFAFGLHVTSVDYFSNLLGRFRPSLAS